MQEKSRRVRKAVLPVAGLGTRVLPATKAVPKEMLTVFDRPAIQYVVDEALQAGVEHIVFVTGRNKGAIEDHFDIAYELEDTLARKNKTALLAELGAATPRPGMTSFVRQQRPLGLGHAVWCARAVIGDEPFAVLLPDVLVRAPRGCLAQMLDAHAAVGGNLIAVDPVSPDEVHMFGVIEPEPGQKPEGRLTRMRGMVEKPKRELAPSLLRITGRYVLQPEIFAALEAQAPGAGGEIQLTDAMAHLMKEQPFHAYAFDGVSYDCGDKVGYLRACLAFALGDQTHGVAAAAACREELARAGAGAAP